jgi:Fur family transcriptional regulator, ferric uptake regulator
LPSGALRRTVRVKSDFTHHTESEPRMPTTDIASQDLRAGLPSNYRTVLGVVKRAGPGTHLSAQDIWLRARAVQPRLGFATVHRGLARLVEAGAVMKLDVPGKGGAVYEPAGGAHAHFRCIACGALSDLDFAVPATLLGELAARHGVVIERETVLFAGRCASCA